MEALCVTYRRFQNAVAHERYEGQGDHKEARRNGDLHAGEAGPFGPAMDRVTPRSQADTIQAGL